MIAVDTSALIAILKVEAEAASFARIIEAGDRVAVGAPTKFEFLLVSSSLKRHGGETAALNLLLRFGIETHDWRADLADIAFNAFLRFGKGRHPAALNFGDCMAYALAKSLDAPLLFKGSDFDRTDVKIAVA